MWGAGQSGRAKWEMDVGQQSTHTGHTHSEHTHTRNTHRQSAGSVKIEIRLEFCVAFTALVVVIAVACVVVEIIQIFVIVFIVVVAAACPFCGNKTPPTPY